MFTETTRLVRDREIGGKGVWRQGKREIINQSLHSSKSHFNVALIVRDKVSNKTVSTDHNFWRERRAEVDSNRGPSSYQPNALPLGQTGSQNNDSINVCFYPSVFRWVQKVWCYENCYQWMLLHLFPAKEFVPQIQNCLRKKFNKPEMVF